MASDEMKAKNGGMQGRRKMGQDDALTPSRNGGNVPMGPGKRKETSFSESIAS